MGMDCTIAICDNDGTIISDNICDFRNSEWFNLLQEEGCEDTEYAYINWNYGIPDKVSKQIQEDYDNRIESGYFNFRWITADDYVNWFERYRPDISAGWMPTYDKWLYEKKHILNEDNMYRYLASVSLGERKEYQFVEIEKELDDSKYIYDYLMQNEYSKTWNLIFYFDY